MWNGLGNHPTPQVVSCLSELGEIQQMVCSEGSLLALTRTGKVYTMCYTSQSQNPQLVQGLCDKEVIKVAAHPEGKHYLALTAEREVFSWGDGDGGKLGHGDSK